MGVDDEIEQAVKDFGWQFITIRDIDPPFIYSIGFMPQHPEAIIFGLDDAIASAILEHIGSRVKSGEAFEHKRIYDIPLNPGRVAIRRVHQTQIPLYLGCAMGYCRQIGCGDVHAVQVFWPDKDGKFPFDAGCALDVYQCQPRLDTGLTPDEVSAWDRQWE